MTKHRSPWLRAVFASLILCLPLFSIQAQLQTGNIFGTVVSTDNSALPGVTVTLSGVGAPQSTVTDEQGRFRFINLSPSTYSLKAELAGLGSASRSGVSVNIGRNADVTIQLNPSVSQTITVTAEAPLLDVRRTGTGSTVPQAELESVPTARDPWVILQQVPGVLMDRINVGGNESGQQSSFVSKGSGTDQATFSVDGVNTTDMVATGASADYFDFGSFEEIQVATGGTDPRVQTPGAQINIVTKRGTNDITGSARYYIADGQWQSEATPPDEAAGYLRRANEIDQNKEWGIELGGPIIRDRLWLWGAWADQDIDLFVAWPTAAELAVATPGADPDIRYTDKTQLETLNTKLNAQITRNNSAVLFYYNNDKTKQGRNASPTRPPDTTWNQGAYGPPGTYKVEDTHIFSSNFYLTGLYSKVNGGFGLWADNCDDLDCVKEKAGTDGSWVVDLATGVNRNTYFSVNGKRPQEQVRLDGSAFFNTGALSHELKFGFGYRTAAAEGQSLFPNDQVILDYTNLGYPQLGLTYFYAVGPYDYEYQYNDVYVGDTVLWGNLTVQAGLRLDSQRAEAGDQIGPAHPLLPEYMPALTTPGSSVDTMDWETISPRIGLTYALGTEKRTLLRAAYNRYVGQLGSNSAGYNGVVPTWYRYMAFYTFDEDKNDIITRNEILFDNGIYGRPSGFDPDHPTDTDLRRVDPDIEAPSTDEYIVGLEHELLRDFVAGVNYTHRDLGNFVWTQFEKTRGAGDFISRADYILAGTIDNLCNHDRNADTPDIDCTPEVDPYNVGVYTLRPGVEPKYGVLRNRPGYSQTYDGLELSLVKRMANRWMLRGNFSWNDWVQNVEASSIIDPTPLRTGFGCSVCDGADVVQGSGAGSGPKGGVWINSEWAVNAAGVYQIPFIETSLGVNFTMRQGYPILYAHPIFVTEDVLGHPNSFIPRNVLASDVTGHRLPNPYSLDLRLAKDLRFKGIGLELSVDAFNVTDNRPELQRAADLINRGNQRRSRTANRIREIQSPRILRVGARLTF